MTPIFCMLINKSSCPGNKKFSYIFNVSRSDTFAKPTALSRASLEMNGIILHK
ncbi:hypothetical protein DFQ12_0022 [Sphingobacterium detergens]|uniref:Uncharacterized protein n=1 Tax=Sphingobacterium detergens TaxID=1145106 RepID=A0A420BER5_SPHD1|nr:hypothetical protein DFQ12_0022 [Sphingobacterium detergens]